MWIAVKMPRDCSEGFLAGSVPNLKADEVSIVDEQIEFTEIGSDRHVMFISKFACHHLVKHTWLSYGWIADNNQLKNWSQVVIIFLFWGLLINIFGHALWFDFFKLLLIPKIHFHFIKLLLI
jgi:hypothetical protein